MKIKKLPGLLFGKKVKSIFTLFICFLVTTISVAQQTPYNGPHNMPGTIEAEDYDDGGQDISYHDNELGKHPNATVSNYRKENSTDPDLDIEILSGNFSNGHKVGWMNNGDWLEYTFNASKQENDDYIIRVKATSTTAANGDNKGYRLLIDDVVVTGDLKVNPDGGFFSVFLEIDSEVKITEGEHVLRLEVFSTVNNGNTAIDLDVIQFLPKNIGSQTPLNVTKLLGNNGVIQRNTDANIWGTGEPGNTVTIEPGWGATLTAEVDPDGNWSIKIPTIDAGGPYTLEISDITKSFSFNNIMLGEVWLCSGQSNMDIPLSVPWAPVNNSDAEALDAANYPNIRFFRVGRAASYDPESEVNSAGWQICTEGSAKQFSAVGYFFGRDVFKALGQTIPVGLIESAKGSSAGEAWTTANSLVDVTGFENVIADLETARLTPDSGPYKISHINNDSEGFATPGALYNGMIAPVTPYTIKGAIWYQGESNAPRAEQYQEILPALIDAWRTGFNNPNMPFYIAQIAPLLSYDSRNQESYVVREAQFFAQSMPNTGMATLIDIGKIDDIHPPNKQDVGKRLALWALAKDYGQNIVYSGPIYTSSEFSDGKGILSFDSVGSGLEIRTGDVGLFEIAGLDGVFKTAAATVNGNTLEVSSAEVTDPIQVRYAWKNWIENPTFYNADNLPSSSFKTYNAFIFSNDYEVDQEINLIKVPVGQENVSVSDFIAKIATVSEASFKIVDPQDNEVTTGVMSITYRIVSTMDNGQDTKTYGVQLGNDVLSVQDFDFSSFNYFPNPVEDSLIIQNSASDTNIKILSFDGKSLIEKSSKAGEQLTIDTGFLPNGIYLMIVNEQKAFKLIK